MKPLFLASGSPRRRAFLAALGLDFTIEAADIDEEAAPGELPADLVRRLSRTKALAVAARHQEALVLAADTVVVLDGRILGKPADAAAAASMLQDLRGREHQVYTAVSLAADGALATECCCSRVWMRGYTDEEIRAYVATGDPLDKAGGYAIQHPAFAPVARWQGCFASIMGLPLGMAAGLLARAGVQIPRGQVIAACEQTSGSGDCCQRGEASCL